MGYEPSKKQLSRCKKCWYWRPFESDYLSNRYCTYYAVHGIGHRRCDDPCDKYLLLKKGPYMPRFCDDLSLVKKKLIKHLVETNNVKHLNKINNVEEA